MCVNACEDGRDDFTYSNPTEYRRATKSSWTARSGLFRSGITPLIERGIFQRESKVVGQILLWKPVQDGPGKVSSRGGSHEYIAMSFLTNATFDFKAVNHCGSKGGLKS